MPDIIGVEEMQDNNGSINDGTTDASLSAKRIIDAVLEIRGPKYEYVEIAPSNNQDGERLELTFASVSSITHHV